MVNWLPAALSAEPKILWEVSLGQPGLGGIAATSDRVFFGDRDLDNYVDVYRCLDAKTGEQLWDVQQLAIGELDYGNSPRATPVITGDKAIFFGAMGDLSCIEIATGNVTWHNNIVSDFKPMTKLPWGYCGSPLLVGERLVVNPGAELASLVAINSNDGSTDWKTPGRPAAYGSFILTTFGGRQQIVGHDAETIGGWDPRTGKRLWTISPPYDGEFNVPTPINVDGKLLICTEQNGARLFEFDDNGVANPNPIAINKKLKPDMSSPVVVGGNLYLANDFLYCVDAATLKEKWRLRETSISSYGSLIASKNRLLVIADGELLLLGTDGEKEILSRQKIFDSADPIYSHPALVGNRLYVRGETTMKCIEL